MASTFVVYIDESGDEGVKFADGSSEWFVLSAVITRRATDLETVKLVDDVRQALGKPDKKPLHFRDLRHEHRLRYCRNHHHASGEGDGIDAEQVTSLTAGKRMGLQQSGCSPPIPGVVQLSKR